MHELLDLHSGEEVLRYYRYAKPPYSIEIVDHITPTQGVIVLTNGERYSKYGGFRGEHYGSYPPRIEKLTPEKRMRVEDDILVSKMLATDWNALSLEKLRQIEKILQE